MTEFTEGVVIVIIGGIFSPSHFHYVGFLFGVFYNEACTISWPSRLGGQGGTEQSGGSFIFVKVKRDAV